MDRLKILLLFLIAPALLPAQAASITVAEKADEFAKTEAVSLRQGFAVRVDNEISFFDDDMRLLGRQEILKGREQKKDYFIELLPYENGVYALCHRTFNGKSDWITVVYLDPKTTRSYGPYKIGTAFMVIDQMIDGQKIHMLTADQWLDRLPLHKYKIYTLDLATDNWSDTKSFQIPRLPGDDLKKERVKYYRQWLFMPIRNGKFTLARLVYEPTARFMSVEIDPTGQAGAPTVYTPGRTAPGSALQLEPSVLVDTLHGHVYFAGYTKSQEKANFDGIYVHKFAYPGGAHANSIFLDLPAVERTLGIEGFEGCPGIPGFDKERPQLACNPSYFHYDPLNDLFTIQLLDGKPGLLTGFNDKQLNNRQVREYTFNGAGQIQYIEHARYPYNNALLDQKRPRLFHAAERSELYRAPTFDPLKVPATNRNVLASPERYDHTNVYYRRDRAFALRNTSNTDGKVQWLRFGKAGE